MTLRGAVIGLGSQYGLGKQHSIAYNDRPEVGHIVLCDVKKEAADQIAANVQKPTTIYTNVEEMFAKERIDVVSILTPDHLHRTHAELAFAAGANVLLTKPIAPALADARAIIVCAAKAKRKLMIAQERRFHADSIRAKELIASGRLGKLAFINMTELYQAVRQKFANAPWYATKESGRTMITGSGVHQVDLVRHLAGTDVCAVTASGNRVGDISYWHNKTVAAIFRFANAELVGNIVFSYEGMPDMTRGGLIVIGSKGMISLGKFRDRATGEIEDLNAKPVIDSHQACAHAFLNVLCKGAPIPVTGEDAFASVATAMAIDHACESGTTVVPETLS